MKLQGFSFGSPSSGLIVSLSARAADGTGTIDSDGADDGPGVDGPGVDDGPGVSDGPGVGVVGLRTLPGARGEEVYAGRGTMVRTPMGVSKLAVQAGPGTTLGFLVGAAAAGSSYFRFGLCSKPGGGCHVCGFQRLSWSSW